jgi:hypothetical protein
MWAMRLWLDERRFDDNNIEAWAWYRRWARFLRDWTASLQV